ncbi:MAG: hypothetical protein H6925_04765 [Holosporaceae bacterium]|nr:MAG: hypothetical protein H6925_04765 [Holosporaceae bacterium]
MVAQVQNAGTAVGRRQSVTNVLDIVHPAMQRPSRTLVNTTLKAHTLPTLTSPKNGLTKHLKP